MLNKQSSFFQTAQNEKKLGAYYTDIEHCQRIGMLFDFDSAEECNVLEPSVGDGSAVHAVTGGRKNLNLYGVEIQKDTYEESLKNNPAFRAVLNQDFLRGIKVSHGVFSFCFANPPYGTERDGEGGRRLEALFLERISLYLKAGAYLVYVIPYGVFREEKFFRMILTRFDIMAYYRFDDKEYAKYKQVTVVLRKKRAGCSGYLKSDFESQWEMACRPVTEYPYLPKSEDEVQEKYQVLASRDSDIEFFAPAFFEPEEAAEYLDSSPAWSFFADKCFQKTYSGCDLSQPIVPVSKDISYLLAVTGGGQGLAGRAEEGTLHLQRGVAKRVSEEGAVVNETTGKADKMSVRTYTRIALTIVENDGTITTL